LAAEKRNGDFVRSLIEAGRLDTVHDVSDGGMLVAVGEKAMANGIGAKLTTEESIAPLFGEDQARYVIAVPEKQGAAILADAKSAGVPVRIIGTAGGSELVLSGDRIVVAKLRTAHEAWFPNYMGADPV